jgi:hypothetical protein
MEQKTCVPKAVNNQPVLLLRSFDDFYQPPAFVFAERAGFHDAHHVTNFAGIFFVVGEEFFGALYELAVKWVHQASFHLNRNGFVHFIRHNHAGFLFAKISY